MNQDFKCDVKHVPFKDLEMTQSTDASMSHEETLIDNGKDRYPYCIVWTAIPGLTNCMPFIGHTGICTSTGIIHDFSNSYRVSVDNMGFGRPLKYVELTPESHSLAVWDEAIEKADLKYRRESHNLFTNNCHGHVAHVLNLMKYKGKTNWNQAHVWWMVTFNSKWITPHSSGRVIVGFIFFVLVLILLNLI